MNKVSLVVTTYNEERNIETLLTSIQNQTYPEIEIIVVDSERTTDSTSQIARRFTDNIFKLGKERSPQRNHGVKKAVGEHVLILDADMKLEPKVVEDCVKKAQADLKVKAVIIPETSYGESYWAKCKALERNCYIGDENIEAARFFEKEVYEEVGGFNEKMVSGEDWDLSNRIRAAGYKIGRINSFIHHNEGNISLWKDLQKKLYYARQSEAYIQNNVSGIGNVVKYIFRPAYFRNWKKLISDPIHFPGFVLMKFLEFFVGGLAVMAKREFWRKVLK